MVLQNDRELANAREKLRLLEESYEEARRDDTADQELREAEMESLRQLINQLREETSHYEDHPPR